MRCQKWNGDLNQTGGGAYSLKKVEGVVRVDDTIC